MSPAKGIRNRGSVSFKGRYADDLQRCSLRHFVVSSGVNPGGAGGIGATLSLAYGGATVGFGVRVMVDLCKSMQVRVVLEDFLR